MRNRETVLSEIKQAVFDERESQLHVLRLLREIETDRHFLSMGYPNLFEFATRELGYSSGSAMRRIQSMRLLKTAPQMEEKIQDGSLSLCVAAKTQGFLRREDQLRKQNGQDKLSVEARREMIESMVGASTRECERRLAELSPEAALPPEKARPISNEKTLIQFVADTELVEKLEQLKNLLAHQTDGSYGQLIEKLAELALKKLSPEKEKARLLPALAPSKTRFIPAGVRRELWKRAGGSCTYTDPKTGKRCGSRHAIQFDHIRPDAWSGETSVENLRLRCRAHNMYTARLQGLAR